MDDLYHIAATPGGYHVHRIDPVAVNARATKLREADPDLDQPNAVAEVHGEIAEEIRNRLGFPIRGRWLNREGWDSSLSPGVPHFQLMAIIVGTPSAHSSDIVIDDLLLATECEPAR
jgi:hypothetical protein